MDRVDKVVGSMIRTAHKVIASYKIVIGRNNCCYYCIVIQEKVIWLKCYSLWDWDLKILNHYY